MSVEFPYPNLPRAIWERQLAHLKEMGVSHVSLPA
jgi:beta-galactosidase GanA